MDSASSSRQSSKLSIADADKKRDKKHKKSGSSVEVKHDASNPNVNNSEDTNDNGKTNNSESVTDFLNDPSLQTGIKHSLTRSSKKYL